MGVFPGSSISRCASNRFTSVFPSNWGSPSNTPRRDAAVEADVDWRGVVLPAEVHGDLTSAIRDHSVTRLRRHVKALEQLGVEGQALAAHLGDLMRRYDMDGVKTVLETIEHK